MQAYTVALFFLGISASAAQDGCRMLKCRSCDYGYARDSNGCQTCTCIPNPCNTMDCDPDATCEVEQVYGCDDPPCDALAVCKTQCPDLSCLSLTNCDYGRVYDDNGCVTCQCKAHPCAAMTCGPDQTCEVVEPDCITTHYYPEGRCMSFIDDEPSCPFGDPLPCNPNCGLGGVLCPDTHFCYTHPTDRYAVCCAKRPDPCADHECPERQRCVARPVLCLAQHCPETAFCIPTYK